jgi:hypothetical protein
VAQWVSRVWEQVTTATVVNTWKSIGHKVDGDTDDNEDKISANQPGKGKSRGKLQLQLLSSNTTLTMMTITDPSSWT